MSSRIALTLFILSVFSCNTDRNTSTSTETINSSVQDPLPLPTEVVFTTLNMEEKKIAPDRLSFINFWATWCVPCIREMPSLRKMMDKSGKSIDYYIASYESIEKVREFASSSGSDLPFVIFDDSRIPQDFQTSLLPYTVIMKGDSLLYSKTGATEWSEGPEFLKIQSIIRANK